MRRLSIEAIEDSVGLHDESAPDRQTMPKQFSHESAAFGNTREQFHLGL
jgi:hypothetical protein